MESINPLVIFPGALSTRSKEIAEGLVQSITQSGGQMCTKPGVVFTIGSNDAFMKHLEKTVKDVPPIFPLNANIRSNYLSAVHKMSLYRGISVHGQGKTEKNAVPATIISVDSKTFYDYPWLHKEVFGPVTIIVNCQNEFEAQNAIVHFGRIFYFYQP